MYPVRATWNFTCPLLRLRVFYICLTNSGGNTRAAISAPAASEDSHIKMMKSKCSSDSPKNQNEGRISSSLAYVIPTESPSEVQYFLADIRCNLTPRWGRIPSTN